MSIAIMAYEWNFCSNRNFSSHIFSNFYIVCKIDCLNFLLIKVFNLNFFVQSINLYFFLSKSSVLHIFLIGYYIMTRELARSKNGQI